MKRLFLLLTIALLSLGAIQNTNAQTYSVEAVNHAAMKKDGKYGIMVDNGNYLMASIVTGEMYKAYSTDIQFEVVLICSVVKELAEEKQDIHNIEIEYKLVVSIDVFTS